MRNQTYAGKTLRELADAPVTRGIYLRKIMRNLVEIPILPGTEVLRGDVLTVQGSRAHVDVLVKAIEGHADRPAEATDLKVVAAGIVVGGLVGALSITLGGIPIGLSTSGGALLAGLLLGYFRAVRRTFGSIPGPALWLLNTLGLNVFIAVVGINAAPGFVAGLQQVGISLFLWGAVATSLPLIAAVLIGHLVFKFPPAILFGVCAGVRTTTAAIGDDTGNGAKQGARTGIRDALRGRPDGAHDLRHDHRPDDERQLILSPSPLFNVWGEDHGCTYA